MSKRASFCLAGLLFASVAYAQESPSCDSALNNVPAIETTVTAKPLMMHANIFPLGEYMVRAFSPDSWVSLEKEQARKTLSTYSPSASDMKDVLRVAITPPSELTEAAQDNRLNISVVNAVLRSTDQSATVAPLCAVRVPVSFQNNFGAKWSFDSMLLIFDLRDIKKDLIAGKHLEISVVVGTGKIHDFVLGQKQLAILGLE